MDELVKMVAEKAGVPEAKAKVAVEVIIGYLKKNLPAPVAQQIDTLLAGANVAKDAGNISKKLGGLFGKQ